MGGEKWECGIGLVIGKSNTDEKYVICIKPSNIFKDGILEKIR